MAMWWELQGLSSGYAKSHPSIEWSYFAPIAQLAVVAAGQPGAITDPGGLGLLVAVSVLFVLLGAIPGTAKQVWSGPRTEL